MLKNSQLLSEPLPDPVASFEQITLPLASVVSFPLFPKPEQLSVEMTRPESDDVAVVTVSGPVIETDEPLNVDAVIVELEIFDPDMFERSTLELPPEEEDAGLVRVRVSTADLTF